MLHFLFVANTFKGQNDLHTLNCFYSAAPVVVFQGDDMLKIRLFYMTVLH